MIRKIIYVAIFAVLVYMVDVYNDGCSYDPKNVRVDGKVIIVTGSNTGIGKQTVIDLVKRGGKVYMACRSLTRGKEALDDIKKLTGVPDDHLHLLELDLGSLASVRNFVQEFKKRESRLDILINNAGVMIPPYMQTADGFELQFGTNHLGPFLLTNLLADLLIASAPSRVVVVSSMAQHWGTINFDNLNPGKEEYSSGNGYTQSKLANVIFARELSKRLSGLGVTAYSLHPGGIETDLQRHVMVLKVPILGDVLSLMFSPFFKSLWHGARTTIYTAIEPGLENESGKYFSDCAVKEPNAEGTNDEIGRRLWEISMESTKLDPSEVPAPLRK